MNKQVLNTLLLFCYESASWRIRGKNKWCLSLVKYDFTAPHGEYPEIFPGDVHPTRLKPYSPPLENTTGARNALAGEIAMVHHAHSR